MNSEEITHGPLFPPLNAEDDQQEVTEIESLCLNCHQQVALNLSFILCT